MQPDRRMIGSTAWGLIIIIGWLSAVGPLSIDMYLPGLPAIVDDLTTTPSLAQISVSVFFLGLALGQLIFGPLSDRFGRRPALSFGFGLFLLASLVCAVTRSIEALIIARGIQGLGAATSPAAGRAIIRDCWSGDAAARAMSFVMAVMSVAPLLAPLLGAQILIWFGWRAVFWVLATFALLSLLIITWWLPETNGAEHRSGAHLGTVYRAYGRILTDPIALAWLACGGLIGASLFAYITSSAFLYIDVFGVKPAYFGFYFGLNVIGMLVGNMVNARLVSRFGYGRMLGSASVVLVLASAVLVSTSWWGWQSLGMMVVCLFFAVGVVSMASANALTGLLDLYPGNAGACSALFGLLQYGLGALAGVTAGYFYTGTPLSMAAVMLVAGLGAYLAYRLLTKRRKYPLRPDY